MPLYSVLSLLAFKNPPRRTPRPSKLSAKTQVPIPFCFCIIISLELHGQFYTLFHSSTLRYLTHWKRVILPRTSWGSGVHTFLVKFQCTFHLLRKVRYIIIIPTAVRVCNWQHFLLITILIIIPINKIINHHNQCITGVSVICPALYSWRCLVR